MKSLASLKKGLNLTEYENQKSLSKVSRLIIDEMYRRDMPDTEFAKTYNISEKDMDDIQHFDYNPSLMEMIELFGRMGLDLEITTKPKQASEMPNSISVSEYMRMRGKRY